MPNALSAPTTRVVIRLYTADLATLSAARPREVNAVVRELVRAYCERLRAGAAGPM